jgi:hypothetical protein
MGDAGILRITSGSRRRVHYCGKVTRAACPYQFKVAAAYCSRTGDGNAQRRLMFSRYQNCLLNSWPEPAVPGSCVYRATEHGLFLVFVRDHRFIIFVRHDARRVTARNVSERHCRTQVDAA